MRPSQAWRPLTTDPVWRGAAPSRPALSGDVSADLCIIGLGGSGLTAILTALQLGLTVVGVDAAAIGASAAGRNGGLLLAGMVDFYDEVVAAHGRERAAALYAHTLEELDRTAATAPADVRRAGSLRLVSGDGERAAAQRHLQALLDDDFPACWHAEGGSEGVFLPTDGVFQPWQRCQTLAAMAEARGARLFEGSPVTHYANDHVQTLAGLVRCQQVIIAVDGRLELLVPSLQGRVRTARLQMLATEPGAAPPSDVGAYDRYGYDYWQRLPNGRVIVGGGRDVEGDAAFTTEDGTSLTVQSYLESLLRDRLAIDAPITHRWVGLVGYCDDRLPICEAVSPGVIAIGAYCGTGNVVGALCGRAAAHLAAGGDHAFSRLLRRCREGATP